MNIDFETLLHSRLATSFVCVFIILAIRFVLVWQIRRRSDIFGESQRRWVSNVKNGMTLVIMLSLLSIWISELQDLVFSVAAFLVAIVIALKEFILCLVGSFYQAMSRPFSVGDWIQVDKYTGEVVDRDWVSTTLLDIDVEAGAYNFTGKTLELPNSIFLSHVVRKMHFMRRYIVHTFAICRPSDVNFYELQSEILETAAQACAHFYDIAQRYQQLIQKRLGIELPGPDPGVRILTNDIGHSVMRITIFCPVNEAINIEQLITEKFMKLWHAALDKKNEAHASTKESST